MPPVLTCLGCGQADDHPKHIHGLLDGSDAVWHHDCHARSSAACAICAAVVASSTAKGDELREHIRANNPGRSAAEALNAAQVDHFKLEG